MSPLSAIRQFLPGELPALSMQPEAVALPTPLKDSGQIGEGNFIAPLPEHGSFGNILGRLVNDVNGRQATAGEAVGALLNGQNVSLHQAMIAMEEASVSFQLMVEVRNKLLDAYQELMRMQI